MAVVEMIPKHTKIGDTVRYVCNREKTRVDKLSMEEYLSVDTSKYLCDGKLMSGINCHAGTAKKEMTFVQDRFAQRHSVIECYHAVQSFKTGEVTALECHRIGVELAELYWGSEYQVLVTTHVNTDQYHNHFVINPVSMWTGRKWEFRKSKLNECRKVSDQLCIEHGLSVIRHPSKGTSKILNRIERDGGPTKYNLMRESLDRVLDFSCSVDEFIDGMRLEGYIVSQETTKNGDRTIRTVNDTRAVSLGTLGNYYDRRIYNILERNDVIGDMTGVPARKRRFYEEKMKQILSLDQNRENSKRGMDLRGMTLTDQYNELKKILDTSPHDQGGYGILSPECRLASEKEKWYRKQIEICGLYQFKSVEEVTEVRKKLEQVRDRVVNGAIDKLPKTARKRERDEEQRINRSKDSIKPLHIAVNEKKMNDTIKILKQMEKHAPKIQALLKAEAETTQDLEKIVEIEKYMLGDLWAERDVQEDAQKIRFVIYSLEREKNTGGGKEYVMEWFQNYKNEMLRDYYQRNSRSYIDLER